MRSSHSSRPDTTPPASLSPSFIASSRSTVARSRSTARGGWAPSSFCASPKAMPEGRILVVDDELSMREVLDITLRQEGYEVTLVDGGEAALRVLDGATFDLVLTDLRMPNVDGLAVLRAVKERAAGAGSAELRGPQPQNARGLRDHPQDR